MIHAGPENWLLINNVVVFKSRDLEIIKQRARKFTKDKNNKVEILEDVKISNITYESPDADILTFRFDKISLLDSILES